MSGDFEYPDKTPVAFPIKFERRESLSARTHRIAMQALADFMARQNPQFETAQDADNFDVDEYASDLDFGRTEYDDDDNRPRFTPFTPVDEPDETITEKAQASKSEQVTDDGGTDASGE